MNCVAFKPDNPNIVVSGSDDKTIIVWDITSGSCLSTLRGHTARVRSVCFSPDGAKIVSGSWDKKVLIWDAASGEQLCSLNVGGSVSSIDFAPCGNKLAAAFNIYDQWGCLKEGGVKIFSNQGSAGFVCQSTLNVGYAPFSLDVGVVFNQI